MFVTGQAALEDLLASLKSEGYRFIAPTPATHRRALQLKREARSLRDVFGWSLPFADGALSPDWVERMKAAGVLTHAKDGRLKSAVRVSNLGPDLFLHSAFPSSTKDAVFFGPDTYRFARFLRSELRDWFRRGGLLVDIGAGSGAGAACAARIVRPDRTVLTDINDTALTFARINLRQAGIPVEIRHGSGLDTVDDQPDLIIANPPFMAGEGGRAYRDGGDMHGAALSLKWLDDGARRLAPRGRLLMYTGSAIVEGVDALREAVRQRLDPEEFALSYEEIDPDIFGEMVGSGDYADVERIAAIGIVIQRRP